MINEELTNQLEKKLSKTQIIRRVIEAIIYIVFLVLGIVCYILREESKKVIIHDEAIFTWKEVIYNNNYIAGIVVGLFVSFFFFIFFIMDLLAGRFATTNANGHFITVYKGMTSCFVYINGEKKGKLGFFCFNCVVETKLPDGVKVVVSFSRSIFTIAHISYSDNNPSVDI